MQIRTASLNDVEVLNIYDKHVEKTEIINLVNNKRIFILEINNKIVGWLRYNLFWDNTPFMNMLYILENYRNKNYGTLLVNHFEKEMEKLGYNYLLTSTPSDETSINFYQKLGYKISGELFYKNDPKELILSKSI